MTSRTLIFRSLRFHWRSHLGVLLGAAIGSAALIGALVVGDSVRGSLRENALRRLNGATLAMFTRDRFFRANLLAETNATSTLMLPGVAARQDGIARANRVQVLGVAKDFSANDKYPLEIQRGEILLNAALSAQLNAAVGDEIIIRIPKPSALSQDAVLSPRNENSIALRLKVRGTVPPLPGDFSLNAGQLPPLNAFVSRDELQDAAKLSGRANALLIRDGSDPDLLARSQSQLQTEWRLADAQLNLRAVSNSIELNTSRVFIDPSATRAATAADTNAQPILTYFANLLRTGTNTTPYSFITATGEPVTPADLRDDEIILNQWLADDLQAKPGDEISLTYFDPESGAKLVERTNTFRVRSVVPMEMPWADRTLMPEFPGIEKAESTSDWDAGFPLVHKIRQKDEDYWKAFRGTPKAFVTLAAGQKMWANRFGNLTAIRFSIPGSESRLQAAGQGVALSPDRLKAELQTAEDYRAALERKILANLKPEELGLRFEPVREQALKAAAQSQDFGGLFLGFSLFLIAAALLLMALLFQFGIEQRMTEIGTLLALGFMPKQVRRLLLGEGATLAFIGGIVGTAGGIFYARAMLHGLRTIWRDAIGGSALHFFATPTSLAIGLFASTFVAILTIWFALRRQAKRPARELLAGETGEAQKAIGGKWRRNRSLIIGAVSMLGAVTLCIEAIAKNDSANAEIFFIAGSLLLIAALAFVSWRLQKTKPAAGLNLLSSSSLALRGISRRRSRSLVTVALLACGSFLIVSIGAFHLDANLDSTKRSSGTGGFALLGETTLPVVQDLNSASGKEFFGLSEKDLAEVSFVPFRVHEGDDASCLNLNRAQRPRLLGVKPALLEGKFAFAKGTGWNSLINTGLQPGETGTQKPGNRLNGFPESSSTSTGLKPGVNENEIPAIGDANSIQWALHKKVGDTIDYTDERGNVFKLRLIGAVANSILQGSLIIDEAEFVKKFPGESGYKMFLIDAPTNSTAQVSATLSRAMQDVGLELTPTAQRLNQFNAVQNTYLGTFQILGGLGLLLGSAGLGIVVMRNVLERRGELGVMLAVGFRRRTLQWLVLSEHGALLGLGLGIGILAAAVAVLPALISRGGTFPVASLTLTLAAVLANGTIWTWLATRHALRGNLLAALRNE